ncbi:DNA cytosine methyltransferase [Utexia brackfieldae]|uniref:DNA cytosine methyltransferase n=1 Tax=Utexia brackfieldae TaxID=3074108 RepID=UPI00370D53EA
MKNNKILVIDLFAGPGGLGEGFSSCQTSTGEAVFQIGVSIEKDPSAHRTLTTRALFRKLANNPEAKKDYYHYVQGKITQEQLFEKYPAESALALEETLKAPQTLGEDNSFIHEKIKELVEHHEGAKVVIGGPPCQAYSLAGRSRNAGNKEYKAEEDHRHFLYKEYLKVLSIAKPEVFVMENVRGILSAKVNNKLIFPDILKDLRNPGAATNTPDMSEYKIYSLVTKADDPAHPDYKNLSDFLIRSERYGIPQARHRVILLGVRNDIKAIPDILTRSEHYPVTVKSIINDLPVLRSGLSKQKDTEELWAKTISLHITRLKKLLEKQYDQDVLASLKLEPRRELPRESSQYDDKKITSIEEPLKSWLLDNKLQCVLNHETRGHIESDLLRYSFCAIYALLNNGTSPKSRDFPAELAPMHANWQTGSHADRFRVQSAENFATTITSHISKDGHYFIHYDPTQCRSLTVREAARLQTFPDNYYFEGNRTQQYVQVGNAVPPFLAKQIGEIVMKLLYK